MATPTREMDANDNTEQEPIIKQEIPATWELPREVDLLSDDGSQDDATGLSGNGPDEATNNSRSEKRRTNTSADLKEIQRKLCDKYRTRKPTKQRQPKPEPEPESDPEPEPEPEESEGELDDEAKDAEFERAKKAYYRKKKANKLSMQDEIEFMQMEGDFMARKRKREADEEFDNRAETEPSEEDDQKCLFVSPAPRFEDDDSDESAKPKSRKRARTDGFDVPKKGRGRAKKVLGQDYTDQDVDDVLTNARRKSAAKPKAKALAKPKPKVSKAKPASKAKGSKGKTQQGAQMTNLTNMFGGNLFEETARNTARSTQPTFHNTTRKDDALKNLIASVPQDSVHISRADKKHLEQATKEFTGQGSVFPAENGHWGVKGMKTTLKHFQVLGAGFMRARETQESEPRGGILADEMGLGKTIMMLANIVNGRPATRIKLRTTLVIASPALISQWFAEIRAHTHTSRENKHGLGKVMVYKAGSRFKSNDDAGFLEEADVVLTTYHEVLKSYPKVEIPPEKVTARQKEDWWQEFFQENCGILHRIKWLRICLDEAQAIKNRNSTTSKACRALQARHRWCITGTPLLNSITEMYPYLAFIREPHTGSFKIFKENFCSPNDPDGKDKLGVLLRRVMIRRSHIDKIFGAKLIDIPRPSETTMWLDLNEIERNIYDIVRARFIERINTISRKGNLNKNYSHIWVLILRLRQLCSHPLMISDTCLELLERSDYEALNKITASEDTLSDEGAALLVHLRQVLRESMDKEKDGDTSGSTIVMQQNEGESCATGMVDVYGDEEDVGNAFGLNYNFSRYLKDYKHSKHWENMVARTTCCGCRQPPQDPYMTSCLHIYCHTCLLELSHYSAKKGHDQARCNECGTAYTSSHELQDTPGKPLSSSSDGSDDNNGRKRKKKGKKDDGIDWISAPGPVLPSAKTMAVKAAILNYFEQDPSTKIIVYTQWNPMVRILEKMCRTEGWQSRSYTGKMSVEAKDRAVHEFSNMPDVNILLAGLKCGGLGLNLTAAQKVLLIDPWWNKAIEQQAFCRVFRIGQQSPTSLTRFVCRNTIDEAIEMVKEKKQLEIDELMHNSKLRDKLTVTDLMRLFGQVEEEDGRPFIFADAQDNEGVPRPDLDEDNEFGYMNTDE